MGILAHSRTIYRRLRSGGPRFVTNDVVVGKNVHFGRGVIFNCKRVRIGDGTIFHDDVRIDAEVFEVGDYGTFYPHFFVPGPGELRIGHNFWVGISSIIDAMGGTSIGNNVCVAANSQLWTHMIFGDVMYGCRFHTRKPLKIGDDVWLGARTLVSPVSIGSRSLVLMGSLVTKDIPPDRTYGGFPAEDVTEKLGPQFVVTSWDDRINYLKTRFREYNARYPEDRVFDRSQIVATEEGSSGNVDGRIIFNVARRTYTKRGLQMENRLMRFLLPDAKFVPDISS